MPLNIYTMYLKKTIPYCLLLLIPILSPTSYFEKIFGTHGNDYSRSVKQLDDGSIYLFGDSDSGSFGSNDLSLSKLDKDGHLLWTKYYGGPDWENGFYLNITQDNNFVFVGEQITSTSSDIVIYKVDTAGNVIWNKRYSTPLNETPNYIEQTADGGYIISGSQNDSLGYFDLFVLKLDALGAYQWHKALGPARNEYAKMIHEVKDGYVLIGDMGDSLNNYDVIVCKLDTLGNKIWAKSYGDSLANGSQGFIVTNDGNYLLYGETETSAGDRFDGFLEKIDPEGSSLWRKTYGGTGADAIFSVTEASSGGFVCTGYSNSYNGNNPLDLFILKTDSSGNMLWHQTYGGNGIDIGYELIRNTDDTGYIITGKTFSDSDDYYLLQVNPAGIITQITPPFGELKSIEIYPNPSSQYLTVDYDLDQNGVLEIRNMNGSLLKSIILPGKKDKLSFSTFDLPKGMYVCSVLVHRQLIAVKQLLID